MANTPSTSPMGVPARGLMQWYEVPGTALRQEMVELLQAQPSEAVIRSAVKLSVNTRVYLKTSTHVWNGIVLSCRPEDLHFVVAIAPRKGEHITTAFAVDPGVLDVENFMTEEQEQAVLDQLAAGEDESVFNRGSTEHELKRRNAHCG